MASARGRVGAPPDQEREVSLISTNAGARSGGRHRLQRAQAMIRRYPGRAASAVATGALVISAAFTVPALAAVAGPPPPTPDNSPAAQAARAEPLAAGTPCSVSARACVDLDSQQAWILHNGKVTRGPMRISSGGNHQATPIAHSDRVYRKDPNHLSQESRLPNGQPAPMPWSTFFHDGGIAFHGGSPDRASAGCIHMVVADAKATYDDLQIGDKVQVVSAKAELAARHLPPPPGAKPPPPPKGKPAPPPPAPKPAPKR